MAVSTGSHHVEDGDISVVRVIDGICMFQLARHEHRQNLISITSRRDADDLIIALMVARDTLWPISTQTTE